MGSLHGYMLDHPKYDLRVFIGAINQFKPEVIFTEVRPQFSGPIDGSIDGGIEQSFVYAFADFNKVDVVPIDWFDDEYISLNKAENIQEQTDARVSEKISPLYSEYLDQFKKASFEELNGPRVTRLVQSIYDLYDTFGYRSSKIRNEKICSNFKAALSKYQGKRILTVFGLDHRYFLEKCVEGKDLKVLDISEWYNPSHSTIESKVIEVSIQNLDSSLAVLKKRLDTNYYQFDFQERLKRKVKSYGLGASIFWS